MTTGLKIENKFFDNIVVNRVGNNVKLSLRKIPSDGFKIDSLGNSFLGRFINNSLDFPFLYDKYRMLTYKENQKEDIHEMLLDFNKILFYVELYYLDHSVAKGLRYSTRTHPTFISVWAIRHYVNIDLKTFDLEDEDCLRPLSFEFNDFLTVLIQQYSKQDPNLELDQLVVYVQFKEEESDSDSEKKTNES